MDGIEHFRWGPRRRLKVSWEPVEAEGATRDRWPRPPPLTEETLADLGRYLHQVLAPGYRVTEEQAERSLSPLEEGLEVGQVREVFGAVLYDDHLRAYQVETAILATLHLAEGRSHSLFQTASHLGAPHLVTFHLGRPVAEPMAEDLELVQTLVNLGAVNHLTLVDHLLVSQEGDWVSLRAWPFRSWPEPHPALFGRSIPAMARTPAPSARPRRYRDRFAGGTWSGQTPHRPAWLQEELDEGRQLEEFEVSSPKATRPPGPWSKETALVEFLKALEAQVATGEVLPALPVFLRGCRELLGLNRQVLRRLTGFSSNSLTYWERGRRPNPANRQRLLILVQWVDALVRRIGPEGVADWVQAPHPQLAGRTPLEVLETGPAERLWQMARWLEEQQPAP